MQLTLLHLALVAVPAVFAAPTPVADTTTHPNHGPGSQKHDPYYTDLDCGLNGAYKGWSATYDATSTCKADGQGDHCCGSFNFRSGQQNDFHLGAYPPLMSNKTDAHDLREAIAQSLKTQQSATRGLWTCSFPNGPFVVPNQGDAPDLLGKLGGVLGVVGSAVYDATETLQDDFLLPRAWAEALNYASKDKTGEDKSQLPLSFAHFVRDKQALDCARPQ